MVKLSRLASTATIVALSIAGSNAWAGQAGGSYTLSLNGGASFPISSIDFGSTSVVNNTGAASGKAQLSPVTITVSAATAQLYSLFSSCVTGQRLAKVTATYANSQGQTQFTVAFVPVIVSSFTFPKVDNTSSPLGDITLTLTAGAEQYSVPASATKSGVDTKINSRVLQVAVLPSRTWHTNLVLAASSGKFSFTIPNVNTVGVTAVNSFSATSPTGGSSGGGAGKISLTTFSLTVNPTTGANLIQSAQAQARVQTATLILNRPSPTGVNMPMTLVFHNVVFTGFNVGGDNPVATITFSAESMDMQTTENRATYNIGAIQKTF